MVEMVESNESVTTTTVTTTMEDNSANATNNTTAAAIEEIPDRQMPLSFVSERHLEPIEGISCITQTWRMKERVSTTTTLLFLINKQLLCLVCLFETDENGECGIGFMFKRWR